MPSHQTPDGRWHHVFSASWLKDYATCPERARRRYFDPVRKGPTDFVALGSAVHAGIEAALRARLGEETPGVHAAAHSTLGAIEAEDGFAEVKFDAATRRRLIDQHLATFMGRVLPQLQPLLVEHDFQVGLYEDAFRTIEMRGRIDYVDAALGGIDWKTAGSPHKVWEQERWDVQSTVYALAEEARTGSPVDSWRYVVFVHDKDMQTYAVERNDGHKSWLRLQALAAARHIEAGLPLWTLNDAGWWCAAKWCPVWDACKGAHVK